VCLWGGQWWWWWWWTICLHLTQIMYSKMYTKFYNFSTSLDFSFLMIHTYYNAPHPYTWSILSINHMTIIYHCSHFSSAVCLHLTCARIKKCELWGKN
jgi:hypothetical protein